VKVNLEHMKRKYVQKEKEEGRAKAILKVSRTPRKVLRLALLKWSLKKCKKLKKEKLKKSKV